MKSKGPKKSARDSSGKFMSDTEHMIQKLTEVRNAIAAKQRANARSVQAAEVMWRSTMDRMVAGLLPDLGSRTLAVLAHDLPAFYTPGVRKTVNDAKSINVPFLTWLFGGSTQFKREKLAGTLNALKIQLRSWLESQKPAKVFSKYGADGQLEKYGTLKADEADLAARHQETSEQLEKLEAVRKYYAGNSAAKPPKKLADAIANSSAKLRANPSIVSTSERSRDDFDIIRDVYVPIIVWDSILNHRNEVHHHHYDDYRGAGGSFGGGGASDSFPEPATREDRGSGFEVNARTPDHDRSDRGGGFEVNASSTFSSREDRGGGFEVSASSRDSDSFGRIS